MQEAWADHFNPSHDTVVDCVIMALVWNVVRPDKLLSSSVWTRMLKQHESNSSDKQLDEQKSMSAEKTSLSSLGI